MNTLLEKIRSLFDRNDDIDTADKNKQFMIEAIVGLVVLITLIIFAIWLLLRSGGEGDSTFASLFKKSDKAVETVLDTDDNEDARDMSMKPGTDEGDQSTADADSADIAASEKTDESKGIDLNEVSRAKKTGGTKELPQVYTPGKPMEYTGDNYQMPELYGYWDAYQLEAVSDIIKLERMRAITDSLKDSNDFYYYGGEDSTGRPEGKGLAIYANNTYYFGEWKAGQRSGNGMWIRIFPDEPGVVNGVDGVTWHQYSGQWNADYPNGEGQENITYAGPCDEEYAIRNVIGGFNNGFYQGDEYIMTDDGKGSYTDWYGKAKNGVFEYIGSKTGYNGKRAIWKAGDGFDTGEEDDCRWIIPADNADFGIAGLKKGR